MRRFLSFSLICLAGFARCLQAQQTNAFELLEGDRVAFLGDTFIEREQTYGHIEYTLTTHWPERNVTFRNLGWSADTPLVSHAPASIRQKKASIAPRNKSLPSSRPSSSWDMGW